MKNLLITVIFLSLTLCKATWNYGYTIGNSGASYTVIKPTFTGVRPEYVIVKPSHNALRAGLSVFKPNYSGMKPEYKPDYISKPSYSGLRPGLNPTYFTDRREKQIKSKKHTLSMVDKKELKPNKMFNHKLNMVIRPYLLQNSKIFVKQLDSHNGNVVNTYQVNRFEEIVR